MNNLKQLGLGMHNYESSNGVLPPQTVLTFTSAGAVFWKSSWGPSSRITPYMELGTLYNAINYNNKTTDPSNATAVSTQLKVFLCPSEPNQQAFINTNSAGVTTTYGVSNYGWCEGNWYTFGGYRRRAEPERFLHEHQPHVRFLHGRAKQYAAGLGGQDISTRIPQLWHAPTTRTNRPIRVPRRRHRAGERGGGPDSRMRPRHRARGHARRRPFRVVQRQLVLRRRHHGLASQHPVAGWVAAP